MRIRFLLLPIIALSLGLPIETTQAEDLRVMSFNVRYGEAKDGENRWDNRKEFVVETIAAYRPDLLGTQETLDFQKTFLSEKLTGYTAIGVGREDGGQTGEMTALFFRTSRFELLEEGHFWLSETPEVKGSKSWDSSLPRMASWVRLSDKKADSAKPILFVNTHFDHKGAVARNESSRLLREQVRKIGKGCDVILTGDFNAAIDSAPHMTLFDTSEGEPRFVDAYRSLHGTDPSREATFSKFLGGVFVGARIDWIAVSGSWKIQAAAIDRTERDGRSPSDHYPVTATLRRP